MLHASMASMPVLASSCAPRPARALSLQPAGRHLRNIRPQRQAQRVAAHTQTVFAAAAAETGKVISQVEIPAFIPRRDLLEQLTRWALGNAQDDGLANFGINHPEGYQVGYHVEIVRDGITATTIGILFDDEVTIKHEWVGRDSEGFPSLEGKVSEIKGKHLTIKKLDDNKVDDHLRSVIRAFCEALVSALNKYYAFGSCFTDETT